MLPKSSQNTSKMLQMRCRSLRATGFLNDLDPKCSKIVPRAQNVTPKRSPEPQKRFPKHQKRPQNYLQSSENDPELKNASKKVQKRFQSHFPLTHYTLHITLYTLHSTLHSTLYTLHSTLHFTLYTWSLEQPGLYTLHFTHNIHTMHNIHLIEIRE